MIRTTKHILKYSTRHKDYWLKELFELYEAELNCYVDMLHLREMLVDKYPKLEDIKSIYVKGGQWKQVIYKNAYEIIQRNGVNNEIKPNLKNYTITLDSRLFNIKWEKEGEFDGFVEIALPFTKLGYKAQRLQIKLPFKHHKHSLKYRDWALLKTVQIKKVNENYYLHLVWERRAESLKTKGKQIGFDCGYRHLLADSDGKFYGSELKQIYEKLANQQRGSRNYKQTLAFRDNKINEVCNQIPTENYREVVVENLRDVKKNSKFSRKTNNKLQYWSYRKSLMKIKNVCEENGVLFTQVLPAYTSQSCPKCGNVDKNNRLNEKFKCTVCQYEDHADTVGAMNVLNRGKYNSSAAENESKNRMKNFIQKS